MSLRACLFAAALPLACAGGGAGGEGSSLSPTTVSASGGATDSTSTSGSSTADPTDAPTSAADTTTADASTADASTTDATTTDASTTGDPVEPPIECGPLTLCGIQCVDLATDPSNCGSCGVTCVIPRATATCSPGGCAIGKCDDGWFDCDEEVDNGCEQQLAPGQMCGLVCKPDKPEVCNLFDDNCDGQCDEGGLPGCRQGVHRSSSPTLGHFYTLDAAEAMSGDFKVESLNYYFLHAAPGTGVVPFYRCLKPNGRRFYTTSATCENAATSEGPLGHIATDPLCGAVPLFRLYSNGNHFYTTSAAERDNAVAMFGYQYEAVAGYVWTSP